MKIFFSSLTFLYRPSCDIATLCHLYKIVHNLCLLPNPYQPHPRPTLRNLTSFILDPPFCRLTLSHRSFYPYAPTLWNYFSEEIVLCGFLSFFSCSLASVVAVFAPCQFVWSRLVFHSACWFPFVLGLCMSLLGLFGVFRHPFNLLLIQYWVFPGCCRML